MSFSADSPPAGWYADPAGSGGQRYWDGGNWSQVTRPSGGSSAGGVQQQPQTTPYSPYAQGSYGPSVMRQPMLAGFWWRVLAAILDNLIVLVPFGLIILVVAPGQVSEVQDWWNAVVEGALSLDAAQPPPPDMALWQIGLIVGVLDFIYRTVLVSLKGGTLGQLIVGLRVLRDGTQLGTTPTWGVSAIRALGAVVLQQIPIVTWVDALTMLFTAKKQTIHDLIARTVVIKK